MRREMLWLLLLASKLQIGKFELANGTAAAQNATFPLLASALGNR
jgi:hypothetical protein